MNKPVPWKERFFTDYLAKDTQTVDDALKLKGENLPTSLFRYRPWNESTLEEIQTDTIYLAPPDRFNDIFDSWVCCSMESLLLGGKAQVREKLQERGLSSGDLRRVMDSIDPDQKFKKLIFNQTNQPGKETTRLRPGRVLPALALATETGSAKLEENLNKTIRAMIRIACFTTKPINMPMWYHYAKGAATAAATGTGTGTATEATATGIEIETSSDYAGVCLEYDMTRVDELPLVRENIFPVNYQYQMPDMVKILKEHPSQVLKYAATLKNQDWAYEDEWRLILSLGDFYRSPEETPEGMWSEGIKYQFLPVKAVYMGDHIDTENRKTLEKMAGEKGFKLYQMKAERGRYVAEEVKTCVTENN